MPVQQTTIQELATAIMRFVPEQIQTALHSGLLYEIQRLRTAGQTDQQILTALLTTYGGTLAALTESMWTEKLIYRLDSLIDLERLKIK